MKRIMAILICLILLLTGCCFWSAGIPVTKAEWQGNEVVVNEITLRGKDADFIRSFWDSSEWQPGVTKLGYQYTLYVDGRKVYYSSIYGQFDDWGNMEHLELSEADRNAVNQLLSDAFSNAGKMTWVWILAGGALVIVLSTAVILLLKRKKA